MLHRQLLLLLLHSLLILLLSLLGLRLSNLLLLQRKVCR